jgi:hypothetical protein
LQAANLQTKEGRMVKNLCLGIEIAESGDEEFCIVDSMQFSPEGLYFGVD